jgi:hypothetical protein
MPWLAADPVIVLPAQGEALEALVRICRASASGAHAARSGQRSLPSLLPVASARP